MTASDVRDLSKQSGMTSDRAFPRPGADELVEFLQMDPETGETSVYLFDGEFARPVRGEELLHRELDDRLSDAPEVARNGLLDLPIATRDRGRDEVAEETSGDGFEGMDDLVEQFVRRYERAYG